MKKHILLFVSLFCCSSLFSIDEELNNYPQVDCPVNKVTIEWVNRTQPKVYAEIGIATGSTAVEVAKVMPQGGEIHLFDFYDKVDFVEKRLTESGFKKIVGHSNSYKLRDSYNWSLMKLLQKHSEPIFDYVYLDGMHTWDIDGFTFFLVDRLLKPEGYIDFDDYGWSLAISPSLKPSVFPLTEKLYTNEQIRAKGVRLVIELLVRRDPNYVEVVKNKIFQKKPVSTSVH